jgi:hypothetical protein
MMVASAVGGRAGGTLMCTYLCKCVLHGFALTEEGVSVCLALKTYEVRRVELIFWVRDCSLPRGADAPERPAEDLLMLEASLVAAVR